MTNCSSFAKLLSFQTDTPAFCRSKKRFSRIPRETGNYSCFSSINLKKKRQKNTSASFQKELLVDYFRINNMDLVQGCRIEKKTVELPFSRNKVLLFRKNYSEIIYEHFLWKEAMNGKMIMPLNCAHKTDALLMFHCLYHVWWWRFKGIAALYSVGIVQILISPFSSSSTSMINYTTILKDCCSSI